MQCGPSLAVVVFFLHLLPIVVTAATSGHLNHLLPIVVTAATSGHLNFVRTPIHKLLPSKGASLSWA
jgi:hypothetical protein